MIGSESLAPDLFFFASSLPFGRLALQFDSSFCQVQQVLWHKSQLKSTGNQLRI